MSVGLFRCSPGFSTMYSSPLTARLEHHATAMEAAHRVSYLNLLLALSTLHDAIDFSLAGDAPQAAEHLTNGLAQLHTSNEHLSSLSQALVRLRSDLFEGMDVNPAEPLLAREPFVAGMDYDALYRHLAAEGVALPHRVFWDEVASRMRDGGARGGFRLLERQARELQGDLRTLIAHVESTGRLPGRAFGQALHDAAIPVARVMTGFTRLVTTFSYVSICCDRAMHAYEQAANCSPTTQALAAS